jgi:hypothetical protein
LSYFHGELEHFYRQDFAGQHDLPLAGGVLTTDLRYFNSRDSGAAYGGASTTTCSAGNWPTAIPGTPSGAGYQVLDGEAGLPYISGATVYSFSNVGIGKFIEEEEKPGWPAMPTTSPPPGARADVHDPLPERRQWPLRWRVKEWERDAELAYVVQAGRSKAWG